MRSFGSVDQQNDRSARASETTKPEDTIEELNKRYMRFGKKDEIDSIEDAKRYMRFGKRYMRFGRGDELNDDDSKRYMRFGRNYADKRYMRFGRGDEDSSLDDDINKRYM